MRSAFLVFDLVGRNAGLKCEGNARGFIHPKLNDCEKPVLLIPNQYYRPFLKRGGWNLVCQIGVSPVCPSKPASLFSREERTNDDRARLCRELTAELQSPGKRF